VIAFSKNRTYEISQDIAGADFHKRPHTAFVHRFDLVHKADRLRDLRRQMLTDGSRILRITCRVGGGVNVDSGTYDLDVFEISGKRID
jgi:hypothetical protein